MDLQTQIYLDYAATTPVDPLVLEVMLPYFSGTFGNPSSIHQFGQRAEAAMEKARRRVADDLHAQPEEVLFTACGTESDNLALRGAALARRNLNGANHILISPVEHHAVSYTAEQLASLFGFELEYLPVDECGMVQPEEVVRRIRPTTALVSTIYANNEIGTINPVAEIGKLCRERGVSFHSDAVQAAAHLPMDVKADQVDLLAIGAHKFYGPKGIGALYVRKGTPLVSVETGGGQEAGLRAGTQNVPYIVGLAEAFHQAQTQPEARAAHYIAMRDYLVGRVLETIPDARLTGHPSRRLPNHASFVFKGADGNHLLMLLDMAGFACSSGSACKVGNPKPSEVLLAMGISEEWALGSLRVTLGRENTPDQIEQFLKVLPGLVENARQK
jgi:cysteine desulfurase